MISKIIVHGPTRAVALKRLDRALAGTQVAGSVTNLAFLRALAGHTGFAAGDVDTGLIDRDLENLAADPVACSRTRALAALGVLGLHREAQPLQGFRLWAPLRQVARFDYRGERLSAVVEPLAAGRFRVETDAACHEIARVGESWLVDGQTVAAKVVAHGAGVSVFWDNGYHFEPVDPLQVAAEAAMGSGVIAAPMPGLIKAVYVEAGQQVAAGDRLAILEAMKMEHTLTAWRDGVIAEVLAEAGQQVDEGAALIALEQEDAA